MSISNPVMASDEGPEAGAPEPHPSPRLASQYRRGMIGRIGPDLWESLSLACTEIRDLGARETLSRAGEPLGHSALLLEGMMVRYIPAEGGTRGGRSLVSIQVPGDFVDLHGLPLGHLDHDVCTLGSAKIALFPHDDLKAIMERSAEDARTLWLLTMIDASIHRHWIYRSARLRALASIADFICEMDTRLQACGEVVDDRIPLPLLHTDIADVTGLSPVHVSRVAKELREAGLCTLRDGLAEIHDRGRLQQLARFDPAYLYPPVPSTG
ncbi:Crp/Fnr family transcriptional regulator [Oceaniglobus roseus]|uniref:Crp/Fnr family transcriptional regulator n=1 Tax=Oceaniglobus roseus TaxID=1737570 RepID=UPI000C7E9D20|nr:Crp/Fnr family transcriptional regulator [Kandeliimicrobium roseum]